MDVETITTLVLLLLYLLFQFSGRKKPAGPAPETQPDHVPEASQPSNLQDALREIRNVLEPQRKEKPPKKIEVPAQQKLHYKTRLQETRTRIEEVRRTQFPPPQAKFPEYKKGDEFRPTVPTGVERRQTTSSSGREHTLASEKGTKTDVQAGRVVRFLKDPKGARDAFILSQIFSPPRSARK